MKLSKALIASPILFLSLAACDPVPVSGNADAQGRPIAELPESVRSIAAPYQDLSTARVLPKDGCYWYTHVGPVETTLLPLRTNSGNPICTRPQT